MCWPCANIHLKDGSEVLSGTSSACDGEDRWLEQLGFCPDAEEPLTPGSADVVGGGPDGSMPPSARDKPEQMASWLTEHTDGKYAVKAFENLGSKWSETDPESAVVHHHLSTED